MQIDYTGQYAAKEIDRTVSLTSDSARKSFAELRTFKYFSTQIVSLRLANALSNGAKPWCDTIFTASWLYMKSRLSVESSQQAHICWLLLDEGAEMNIWPVHQLTAFTIVQLWPHIWGLLLDPARNKTCIRLWYIQSATSEAFRTVRLWVDVCRLFLDVCLR